MARRSVLPKPERKCSKRLVKHCFPQAYVQKVNKVSMSINQLDSKNMFLSYSCGVIAGGFGILIVGISNDGVSALNKTANLIQTLLTNPNVT